jgi:hypothetical protein
MEHTFKPVHVRVYKVTRSVEQKLHQSKEIVRLVDIEVFEEYVSSECTFSILKFGIHKKNGTIRVATNFRKLN